MRFTDQAGTVRTARTNQLGFYNFADLTVGQNYIFTVSAKGHQFDPRSVFLTERVEDFNFTEQ